MKRFECASSRSFWLQAKTIADLPDDGARRDYMLKLEKGRRRALGDAARQLIAEAA